MSLDAIRSEVQVPPRIHLDLYADDQAVEVERLVGLGASRVHWDRRPPDADYEVLADSEGNCFCVVMPADNGTCVDNVGHCMYGVNTQSAKGRANDSAESREVELSGSST